MPIVPRTLLLLVEPILPLCEGVLLPTVSRELTSPEVTLRTKSLALLLTKVCDLPSFVNVVGIEILELVLELDPIRADVRSTGGTNSDTDSIEPATIALVVDVGTVSEPETGTELTAPETVSEPVLGTKLRVPETDSEPLLGTELTVPVGTTLALLVTVPVGTTLALLVAAAELSETPG